LVEKEDFLVAYQIAFDLVDKEDQGFISAVIEFLSKKEAESAHKDRIGKVITIMRGQISERLALQFLKKNNHTDMLLINKIKDSIGTKNSMLHASTVWCNGIMNAYTTNDAFLRDNLSWTASATNWNRFSATSSLGMIHMGNKKEAMQILNPYFTGVNNPDQQSSPYSTAGAYYAYGLIHANQYSPEVTQFFMDGYRNAGNVEAVQHGVSLGLGIVSIASKNENIYEQLKNTLYNNVDSATIGEAAAYSMGLVMLGSADEVAIEEMVQHASDSQHEKIIRALSISLAMLMYGKEESADTLIEQMVRSKDAIMRYGGMFAIGLAYAGTGNTNAVKKLLSLAVLDVSDDVKRAALMNLGFVLFKTPKNIPETVRHLAESYNPHLRYGAAMAVGVGCAGTGLNEALKLLAPLTNDQTDFVRQGALMALALVFIQVTEE
jgi:26S proteasome regulatory subunit N2